MAGAPLTVERAEAALQRLAIIATRNPIHLPLFNELARRVDGLRAEAAAKASARERAADLALRATDPELADMLS